MSEPDRPWTVTISVRTPSEAVAGWLERTLRPEAAREVPRARTEVHRSGPTSVELAIQARDTGTVRAALNTYLGWVHLALATVPHPPPGPE